eukprot:1552069-Amphidinium_carterae.1
MESESAIRLSHSTSAALRKRKESEGIQFTTQRQRQRQVISHLLDLWQDRSHVKSVLVEGT